MPNAGVASAEQKNDQCSGQDDDDVILPPEVEKRTKSLPSTPCLSERPILKDHNNPIVRALIENRKGFDSSWTVAAGAVFSLSHPFKTTSKNEQQNKELGSETNDPPSNESTEVASDEKSRSAGVRKRRRKGVVPKTPDEVSDAGKTPTRQEMKKTEPEPKTPSPKSGDEIKTSRRKRASSRPKNSSFINSERLMHLKNKVEAAVKEHKVYSMTGHYGSVRKALKDRGWVEKIDSDLKGRRRTFKFDDTDGSLMVKGEANEQCEAEIINRMLRNITEDLCWLSKPYPYCWKDVNKCDMINRLPKAYFSNKVGLATSLANMHWYYEEGVCTTQYPRTYNISARDEFDALQDDFRLTACISTLKWLTGHYKQGGETAVWSAEGRVDTNIIEFSIKRCAEYVKFKEHEDIDMVEVPRTWDHQWDHFLTQFYKLVNEGHILRQALDDPPITVIVSNAQTALNQLRPYWVQMDIEGINNWWIVKPGGRCCGNGILIRNNFEQIANIVNPTVTKETRYVVQKYIEKPLLIYNTKFDIRQWFLVTNVYPMTIWMYKESYLRFCSTNFNLKSMHESIHLCNNAVQRRYKNGKRDSHLPDENMWDSYTFQTHLKTIGYPDAWEDLIYPGMRESFVGALLASQDNMERRKNCFELYGADFMVSEQIVDGPWLIEINSNPAMDASTSVTARMCPQVLEDIIKVVIDRRNDKNASTGAFELAYRQNCPPIPPYLGMSLCIRGKKYLKLSENKNPRRPNFRNKSSESSESSSSSSEEEENIVQKRCYTDFMQPIKTLREEIQRLGREREYLAVKNENHSDSWANDSDTSRGSTDRRMALEGKEIELKKKKMRRKRHKNSQIKGQAKVERKESKVGLTKADNKNKSLIVRAISMPRDGKQQSAVSTANRYWEVQESSRETTQQNSKSMESEGADLVRPLIITGLWEPEFLENGKVADAKRYQPASHVERSMYLRVDGGHSSSRDNSNSSRGSSLAESDRNSSDADGRNSRHSRRSRYHYSEMDLATALSISAPELMVKGRKSNKWSSSKSSMDYFREWKYKIEETRRNCEDVLTKLKFFKENNSRQKFQDIIRQKIAEENKEVVQVRSRPDDRNSEARNHRSYESSAQWSQVKRYTRKWTTDQAEGLLPANSAAENVKNYEPFPRIRVAKTSDIKKKGGERDKRAK